MQLQCIRVVTFRNLNAVQLSLGSGINVFMGDNAQGKTNFLEAASCLADGRSFRGARIADMIQHGTGNSVSEGTVLSDDRQITLKIQFRSFSRTYHVNNNVIGDLKEYVGHVHYVVFCAEAMNISAGEPKYRRDFLDKGVFSIMPRYVIALRDYRKCLYQRNYLLRAAHPDKIHLNTWTEKLINSGSQIVEQRLKYLQKIQPKASYFHGLISSNREILSLHYQSDSCFKSLTREKIEEAMRQQFERVKDDEMRRKITLAGPHRDDLRIHINDKDIRIFGSRGQKRTCVMAMKLAEMALFRDMRNEYPILIMDDVSSELDKRRQVSLMELIPNGVQVLMTVAGQSSLFDGDDNKVFIVQRGSVFEQ
ncbi:DNA replication/repair protein RecF [bacterium]|nr:DNA replication/repair protein RecF [candidate division CSSED10-310 bacterium]